MKKILLLTILSIITIFSVEALTIDTAKTATTKTSDSPLVFSGSVDTYWKYDFSGHANIPTVFVNEQNSASIGMFDIGVKKTTGKALFVGELSFGPRSDQSIPVKDYHIQNLYVSYSVNDKFNLTAGYMSTFVGYEVTSPVSNFNYSTSYIFSNSPFENAGLKATYTFSDKVSLMVGVFNNYWNTYTSQRFLSSNVVASGDVSTFGTQLTLNPIKGWTAYLNLLSGPYSGTLFDLTTAYQISDKFKLGLNGASFTPSHGVGGFDGIALYPQLSVSKEVAFGLRGEYFEYQNGGGNVTAFTLTSNIKIGSLTIIPEIRLDSKSDSFITPAPFVNASGAFVNHASQFVLAAVYSF